MTTIRKRSWATPKGEEKTAWLVDYRDSKGARRSKQFSRKKDAEAWQTQAAWHVIQGTHTPDSQSITVRRAAEHWLARACRERLEPTTIAAYEQHVRLHLNPLCGDKKLSHLTRPIAEGLRDDLVERLSRPMAARVMRSLASIVREAQRRGLVAQNVCTGVTVRRAKREKARVVIPTKAEMKALVIAARASSDPMDAPLVVTCIFLGLRASELRGLTWGHIDLKRKALSIEQRADAQNNIGPPKSAAGRRVIPLADIVVTELRKWKLQCAQTDLGLVFPSEAKKVISHAVLHKLHLWPVQVQAGVVNLREGKPVARYASHALRHCAASLWIEQRVSPKRVQTWIGHHSIQVTFDTYGHLFEQVDADAAVMQAVELGVMGAADATQMQHGA